MGVVLAPGFVPFLTQWNGGSCSRVGKIIGVDLGEGEGEGLGREEGRAYGAGLWEMEVKGFGGEEGTG